MTKPTTARGSSPGRRRSEEPEICTGKNSCTKASCLLRSQKICQASNMPTVRKLFNGLGRCRRDSEAAIVEDAGGSYPIIFSRPSPC